MNNVWRLIRSAFAAWNEHEGPRLGAALAFYTILSLAPLMVLITAVIALAYGHSNAQDHIISQVQSMIGQDGANAVRAIIEHGQKPRSGIIASALGFITLLFGASGVFGELRSALNKVWDVKPQAKSGLITMIRERFFSLGMVLSIGFLLLVSFVLSAGLAAIGKFLGGLLPVPAWALEALNFFISLVGITLLFALIFKYVPETKVEWKQVWTGAVATAVLFTIGKTLIGLYLGKAAVGSAYGAAGSLVVVIIWTYYSAQIFFFGAELTHVLAGSHTARRRSEPPPRVPDH